MSIDFYLIFVLSRKRNEIVRMRFTDFVLISLVLHNQISAILSSPDAECQDCNDECVPILLEAAEHSMDSSNGIQEHPDGVSHANTVEWVTGFQPISK